MTNIRKIVASACKSGALVFLSLSHEPPLPQPGISVLMSVTGASEEDAVIRLLLEYQGFSPMGVAVECLNGLDSKLVDRRFGGVYFRPMDPQEEQVILQSRLESTPAWELV